MEPLLAALLDANGGTAAWRARSAVRATVRFGGWAFVARGCAAGRRSRTVVADLHAPRVILDAYPRAGSTGHFAASAVWTSGDRRPPRVRHAPAATMRRGHHRWWWDDLDLLYFSGYALWNYLTFPFLLGWPGVSVREVDPGPQAPAWRCLEARFPDDVPTHSRFQRFWVDEAGRLHRHDYTAEAFAPRAHATHWCAAWSRVAGTHVATRRWVVPRTPAGRPLGGPRLVWITLTDLTAATFPTSA